MIGRPDAPFLRSRPHALTTFTSWRALSHGLESAPDGRPKRTILWRNITEVRLAVERDRRDQRLRCDITTREGEWFTIFGPAPCRILSSEPKSGDYGVLVREIIARARKANPSCRFINGRFIWRVAIFHALVLAACVIFIEFLGRFSGMKAEDPTGFAWLQLGATAVLVAWSALVLVWSTPRALDPDAIPPSLLAK